MIVQVMLVDKKLEATMWAIDLLKHIRSYAAVVVLVGVAIYLRNTFPMPVFQRRVARSSAETPSLSLGPEPEEA